MFIPVFLYSITMCSPTATSTSPSRASLDRICTSTHVGHVGKRYLQMVSRKARTLLKVLCSGDDHTPTLQRRHPILCYGHPRCCLLCLWTLCSTGYSAVRALEHSLYAANAWFVESPACQYMPIYRRTIDWANLAHMNMVKAPFHDDPGGRTFVILPQILWKL